MRNCARRARRAPWLWLGALAALAAGYAGYARYGPRRAADLPPLVRWQGGRPDERGAAAKELIASKALLGRALPEVVRDLGPPDRVSPERGDCEWLVGVETRVEAQGLSLPALYDEARYLKVTFAGGRATDAHFHVYGR
jgi:hypothetical protein